MAWPFVRKDFTPEGTDSHNKKEVVLRFLSLIVVVFVLSACGSGGGSTPETRVLSDEMLRLKGSQAEPELSRASYVYDEQLIPLNFVVTGEIDEGQERTVRFQIGETKKVALVLDSPATDLDLALREETGSQTRSIVQLSWADDSSREALVFEAEAFKPYFIEVYAYKGSGSFELKIVEANRTSLKLATNEYFIVPKQLDSKSVCELNGETEESSPGQILGIDLQYIFNPLTGAVRRYGVDMPFSITAEGTFVENDVEPNNSVYGYLLFNYSESAGFYGREVYEVLNGMPGQPRSECTFTAFFDADIVL